MKAGMAMLLFFLLIIKAYIFVIKMVFVGVRFMVTGRATRRGRRYSRRVWR